MNISKLLGRQVSRSLVTKNKTSLAKFHTAPTLFKKKKLTEEEQDKLDDIIQDKKLQIQLEVERQKQQYVSKFSDKEKPVAQAAFDKNVATGLANNLTQQKNFEKKFNALMRKLQENGDELDEDGERELLNSSEFKLLQQEFENNVTGAPTKVSDAFPSMKKFNKDEVDKETLNNVNEISERFPELFTNPSGSVTSAMNDMVSNYKKYPFLMKDGNYTKEDFDAFEKTPLGQQILKTSGFQDLLNDVKIMAPEDSAAATAATAAAFGTGSILDRIKRAKEGSPAPVQQAAAEQSAKQTKQVEVEEDEEPEEPEPRSKSSKKGSSKKGTAKNTTKAASASLSSAQQLREQQEISALKMKQKMLKQSNKQLRKKHLKTLQHAQDEMLVSKEKKGSEKGKVKSAPGDKALRTILLKSDQKTALKEVKDLYSTAAKADSVTDRTKQLKRLGLNERDLPKAIFDKSVNRKDAKQLLQHMEKNSEDYEEKDLMDHLTPEQKRNSRRIQSALDHVMRTYNRDPMFNPVHLTYLETTKDKRIARVKWMSMEKRSLEEMQTINSRLNNASGFFASKVAAHEGLRFAPKIEFYFDHPDGEMTKMIGNGLDDYDHKIIEGAGYRLTELGELYMQASDTTFRSYKKASKQKTSKKV